MIPSFAHKMGISLEITITFRGIWLGRVVGSAKHGPGVGGLCLGGSMTYCWIIRQACDAKTVTRLLRSVGFLGFFFLFPDCHLSVGSIQSLSWPADAGGGDTNG